MMALRLNLSTAMLYPWAICPWPSRAWVSWCLLGPPLSFLVLTWTTVVLLGGFVSILHNKDFWSLTFITLAQTAGIFDANMNEKLGYMKKAYIGLLQAIHVTLFNFSIEAGAEWRFRCYFVLTNILMLVQATMLVMILLPLSIIYIFGIFLSGVISLWRLINHDYGDNSDGEASNLAPAMDTLYYLALLQCVLLCYRFLMGRVGKKLCKLGAGEDPEVELVLQDCLRETKRGCEKNPAFVEGRNLITYAVDKISSNSPTDSVSGVKIMYVAIDMAYSEREIDRVKHLFFSTSSSQYVLQKLLEMLGSRGLHNKETISQVVTIVKKLALDIDLAQFPHGIRHIFSMLQMAELGEANKEQFLQGLVNRYEPTSVLLSCTSSLGS